MAILHFAICMNSVGYLCMAVDVEPRSALSMMAWCSGDISRCSLAACTASATAKIRDCSFEDASPSLHSQAGTRSRIWTGASLTTSPTSFSSFHGLASYAFLASLSI